MMDSAASLAFVTHMLCCTWAICFSAAESSEKDQGSINQSHTDVGPFR
jgi:hypothetical protein